MDDKSNPPAGFNRRKFIAGAAGAAVAPLAARAAGTAANSPPPNDPSLSVEVTLHVNGGDKPLKIDARAQRCSTRCANISA
jgi:xanthine dehydrogenase YagT iron-sulfur-binding subunit